MVTGYTAKLQEGNDGFSITLSEGRFIVHVYKNKDVENGITFDTTPEKGKLAIVNILAEMDRLGIK